MLAIIIVCPFFKGSDYSTAWHDKVSNEMFSLSLNGSDVVADVFEVWSAKGFRFGSHHGDFHFGSSGCTFQFMRLLFPFIFETFQTFGVGVMFRH